LDFYSVKFWRLLMSKPIEKPIMKFFAYAHLPEHLQEISRPIGELAK